MPAGWVDLMKWGANPHYQPGSLDWQKARRQIQIPSGVQRCPHCTFTTDVSDPMGMHVCPYLEDGDGNEFTVGSKVYAFTRGRIKKGEVTKWNQTTQKLSVLIEADEPYVAVLNTPRKALVVPNEG